MKRIFIFALVLVTTGSFRLSDPGNNDTLNVKDKITENFEKTFPGVSNVVWFKQEDGMKAVIEQGDIKTHITYDSEGKVQKSMRFYPCKHLPAFIRAKVYEKYPSCQVTGVTESFMANDLTYQINITEGDKIVILNSDAVGNLTKVKSFKNAAAS